jgi:hypothetical protein
LETYLPRAGTPEFRPPGAGLVRLGRLDVYTSARREPPWQSLERHRECILPERRIQEHHVKGGLATRQVFERIIKYELDRREPDRPLRVFERGERRAIVLDHYDAYRAARSRLETERAAACKKIEASKAIQALTQPIE